MSNDWEVTVITDSHYIKKVRVDDCITRQDAESAALGMIGARKVVASNPKTYKKIEDNVDCMNNKHYLQSSYDDEETSDAQMYMMMIGSVGFLCWILWIFSPVLSCLLAISFILFLIWCFSV